MRSVLGGIYSVCTYAALLLPLTMLPTASAIPRQSQDQDNEASNVSWSRISTYLSQVATDHAFDLPLLEEDLGFLRRCYVLATVCHYVYSYKQTDVGTVSNIELPLAGLLHDTVAVSMKLLHFREAAIGQDMDSPQQYGVWNVTGLGLVVAFRGTASSEDVFIDANITPVPLASDEHMEQSSIHVHRGFYEGARQHAEAIVQVVRQSVAAAGRPLPVWITGHSLGGAYANCLMLHLLESRMTAQLFESGGGSCTFGAPMVVFAEEAIVLYQQLSDFEQAAEAQYAGQAKLQFHNFVNNADIVPRLLGTSLDSVHEAVESYISSMKAVRKTARQYHPFGAYHLILGSSVRTLGLPSRGRERGRLGDAEYASQVNKHLNMNRIWKAVYSTGGKGAGVTHHSIMSYQERLATYIATLSRQQPSGLQGLTLNQETASANMTSLFAPPPATPVPRAASTPLDQDALEAVGRALGTAAQAAALQLGNSAMTMMRERWSATDAAAQSHVGEQSTWTWSSLANRATARSAPDAAPRTAAISSSGQEAPQLSASWLPRNSRWSSTAAESAEVPATWQELGSVVGSALLQYMQQPLHPPEGGEGQQRSRNRRHQAEL